MSIAASFRRLLAPKVYKGFGIDIFAKMEWLNQAGQWPMKSRDAWRLSKLNALIDHCWKNVPFYNHYWSDYGLKNAPLQHVEQLAEYPLVPRDVFKAHRQEAIATCLTSIPHKRDSTGGTTGSPLQYLQDLELHALRYACQMIGWGFAGYRFGDEVFVVSGGSLMPGNRTIRNRARSWLESKRGLYCLQMDEELARSCWTEMKRQKTKIIVGYPSTITLMCSALKRQGLALLGLKAVITTAEMLLPQYRRTIEEFTGVKVFDHYGCNDGGLLSYECELHAGLHYNDLESVLEIVGANQEGMGELAITNLWNRSMPFVRYVNGDLISLKSGLCPCGRKYPLIGKVEGRTADILTFSNGKNLTGPGATLIFKDLKVDAWQIVQVGPETMEIRVRSSETLPAGQEEYIRRVLAQHLGLECRIMIKYVDALSVTRGGKLKPVFSEWDPNKVR